MPNLVNENQGGPCSSWIFYCSSDEDIIKIQKEVDSLFSEYSFYPEIEWGKYGYRAPEGYQILGAWRHPQTRAFAFLLDNPYMFTVKPNTQLLLYISGDEVEIVRLGLKLDSLKAKFAIIDKKDETASELDTRLTRIQKSKSLATITTVLGLFTAIINGFSLYLRKLPPPEINSRLLLKIYQFLLASVHFSAIILLLTVVMILGLFLVKYGLLIIRRL